MFLLLQSVIWLERLLFGSESRRVKECGLSALVPKENDMRDGRNKKAELSAYVDSMERDTTQVRQTGINNHKIGDIKESGKIFIAIFDNAADGILIVDVQNKQFQIGNKAICQMLGCANKEIENMSIEDIHPREKLPEIIEMFNRQVRRELTLAKDIPVKRKDGSVFYADINSFPIKLGSNKYLIGVFRDVMERRDADESLRQSEEKFRLVMEATNDALWDWNLVTGETYRNPRHATMLGYELVELSSSNKEWEKRIHPDDKPLVLKVLKENLSGKKDSFEHEYRLRTKSGDYIWILGRGKVVERNKDGSPVRMIGTNIDITERKKAEEALRQSEETLRSLVNAITESVILIDTKGTVLEINETSARRLGGSVNELMGKCCYDFLHKDIKEYRRSKVEEVIRTGRPHQFEDRTQGRIVSSSMYPILDPAGRVVQVAIFALDITERKRIEQALAESEEKYRTLIETAPDSIAMVDRNGTFLFMNATAAEYIGGKPEELLGKTIRDILPDEVADKYTGYIKGVIDNKKGINIVDEIELRDQKRWYNVTIEPLKDGNRNVISALVIARDIHHIRQAEEQILRLSSAVEQSIDGIAMCDLEPRMLYMNDAYARMHGYTTEEMTGMKIADLHSSESKEECRKVVHHLKIRGAWIGELEHVRKDGKIFPIYLSVTLLKNDEGEAIGSIGICRDMTEYKKTQKDLKIRDVAIASSINGIIIADMEGYVTYMNRSCLKMGGYERESEILGRNIVEYCHDRDEALAVLKTVQDKGSWIGELTVVKKDGSTILVQIYATLVMDERRKPIAMMASLVDITESRRSQEQLNEYREKMSRTEQLATLGTLSATVAHELTQPLTVIRLLLENTLERLQKSSSFPQDVLEKKLMDCLKQVSNIVLITERFRNFARRSKDRIFREVDLKDIAGRIVGVLAESARRANIMLHIEDMVGLPAVYMEERDLEQLFFAIINNAIQAADGENIRLFIVSGIAKGKCIELRFSDNCGGIAPEQINKIFEPFFTTKPRGKGTGLGLFIVQDVVNRAGGRIRVESVYGEGSTFFVTLPINKQ